ncbi:anti-sigma regulatory factor [Virgibacillus flavescens]|uniref:anti-sigma regulatory factor n=1 Tax=Virgibacillus flavescens TaxID=1611422 RepID=UPI003D3428F9
MQTNNKLIVKIENEQHIVQARSATRNVARDLGFNKLDENRITTVVSELARNIYLYSADGYIQIEPIDSGHIKTVVITAKDQGPGIEDIKKVMEVGFSTSGGLGAGLPGVKRLMDEFKINSEVGFGTEIVTKKSIHVLKQKFHYEIRS